jgi:hypothetical protein
MRPNSSAFFPWGLTAESVPNAIFTPDRLAPLLARGLRLGGDARRKRGLRVAAGDVLERHERRDEESALRLHHPERLLVEERAVLDRVDPGADRGLRALEPVRMRRRLLAQAMGLVDDRVHLGLRDLGRVDLVLQGEHPTRRHHLDDVGAVLHVEAHRVPERIGPGRDPVRDSGLLPEAQVRKAVRVGVAAARPERVGRDEHARPGHRAGGDRVPEAHVDEVVGAEVADGREAGEERAPRKHGRPDRLLGRRAPEVGDGIAEIVGPHLERDVRVAIDEAREQRRVPEVDDGGAGRDGQGAADGLDLRAFDEDHRVGDDGVSMPVEEALRFQGDERRLRIRREERSREEDGREDENGVAGAHHLLSFVEEMSGIVRVAPIFMTHARSSG